MANAILFWKLFSDFNVTEDTQKIRNSKFLKKKIEKKINLHIKEFSKEKNTLLNE